MEPVKVGLPPIARSDARLFILGSLPGDASLAAGRYYAHPRNQFWRLLGAALDEELQPLPYGERLDRLAERQVGLWDVVASASRRGSLDQAIRMANHNRLETLLHDYPKLQAVAFNGSAASAIGRKLLGEPDGIALLDLPSSSPANTAPFSEKAALWARLRSFTAPRTCPRA